jgi:hypothetical protein
VPNTLRRGLISWSTADSRARKLLKVCSTPPTRGPRASLEGAPQAVNRTDEPGNQAQWPPEPRHTAARPAVRALSIFAFSRYTSCHICRRALSSVRAGRRGQCSCCRSSGASPRQGVVKRTAHGHRAGSDSCSVAHRRGQPGVLFTRQVPGQHRDICCHRLQAFQFTGTVTSDRRGKRGR